MTRHDGLTGLDDRTWRYTIEILGDCADWRMSTARWKQLDAILGRFEKALRSRSGSGLSRAYQELAVASTFRVPRVSEPADNHAATPERRERINRLVHGLTELPRDRNGDGRPEQERDDRK